MDSQLLSRLVTTPGISAREERIREVVLPEVRPLVDEVRIDSLGNLLCVRHGQGPRVMLSAHMDTIGFLVGHVDDRGFVRLAPVGGFDPRTLVMQRVLVQGKQDLVGLVATAGKPIHLSSPEEREKSPKLEDLYVDLMLPAEEVRANVSVGDPVSLLREPCITERAFAAPYLDDRLGVYVLIQALREAQNTQAEIYAVMSVQEEVGLRGARTGAFGVEPDMGIALDVTIAGDLPGADPASRVSGLGEGVALGLMDSSSISDPRLMRRFRQLAEQHGIPHQMAILPRGGTDAGGMQQSRSGVPVMTVSMPIRYVHTVNEMALASDVDASVSLVARFLETAHEVDLKW
ncbi:MAG: M20/M25/M40 family metallo-hydrolase [Chloroflexota bacterium]|nr:M20/M25/M40 family metallo-hydrolase [Chloroflexota bacterium]